MLVLACDCALYFFFFKQKTAYEMRISYWSSDVCSSDLSIEIQATAGQTYVLNFSPEQAQVQVQDGHFILAFDDDGDGVGDSRVVFLDMVSQVEAGGAPTFEVAGVAVDTGLLLSQAVAMAGQYDQLPYDETAEIGRAHV